MPQRHLKTQPMMRRVLALFAVALFSTVGAFAQSLISALVPTINPGNSWQDALGLGAAKHKVFVVTVDKPDRKQACGVQSFTADKLFCSRALGGSRTISREQVVAIIQPGDGGSRVPLWIGFNGGLGASIWGTVVLAAACPACAAATAIAALIFFCAAGAVAYADDQPDKLLYQAPGQELSRKLGYVER